MKTERVEFHALFSTGPGGRHDWMRFHADDVPCPKKTRIVGGGGHASIPCPGNLKWKETGKVLRCDQNPLHEFRIFEIVKRKPTAKRVKK